MGIPPLSNRVSGNFDFEFQAVRQHTSDRVRTQCLARFSNRLARKIVVGELIISRRIEMPYDQEVCVARAMLVRKKEFHENEF
jgi:hypothetical protein